MIERVLITGISGLLGGNLALTLRDLFDVTGTYHLNPVFIKGCASVATDLRQAGESEKVINHTKPHTVIHCAAETRVDYCEEHPEEAFRTNVEATESLASAAAHAGAKFVYISTDSIFDGSSGGYREDTEPRPVNTYGRSKLLGEQAVQAQLENHLIIRTNIFGWNARRKLSIAEWALDRLENGREVPAFADIRFSPILVNDLADVLVQLIEMDRRGIYHVAASDQCSKFDFARMVCETFEKDPRLIQTTTSEEVGLKALRPKNTTLDVAKVSGDVGEPMPKVLNGLRRFRLLRDNGYVDQLRCSLTQAEVK